jgi:hypothetical protein
MKRAIKTIDRHGVLLVFPINNKKEPHSLWAATYPRTKLRWEWDDNGDNKVFKMWQLMKRLSDCRKVVYSKWYQGRATFFSRKLFTAMLCLLIQKSPERDLTANLPATSRDLLDLLESDSPLSTKELKKAAGMQGKFNAAIYNRSLKNLFSRLLAVAFGEVDDGAFPSLAVGATKTLYEELWLEAQQMDNAQAQAIVDKFMPVESPFRNFFERTRKGL